MAVYGNFTIILHPNAGPRISIRVCQLGPQPRGTSPKLKNTLWGREFEEGSSPQDHLVSFVANYNVRIAQTHQQRDSDTLHTSLALIAGRENCGLIKINITLMEIYDVSRSLRTVHGTDTEAVRRWSNVTLSHRGHASWSWTLMHPLPCPVTTNPWWRA